MTNDEGEGCFYTPLKRSFLLGSFNFKFHSLASISYGKKTVKPSSRSWSSVTLMTEFILLSPLRYRVIPNILKTNQWITYLRLLRYSFALLPSLNEYLRLSRSFFFSYFEPRRIFSASLNSEDGLKSLGKAEFVRCSFTRRSSLSLPFLVGSSLVFPRKSRNHRVQDIIPEISSALELFASFFVETVLRNKRWQKILGL